MLESSSNRFTLKQSRDGALVVVASVTRSRQNFDDPEGIKSTGGGPSCEFKNVYASFTGFCFEGPILGFLQFSAECSLAQAGVFSHFFEK